MTTINEYFEYAQLAQASYSPFGDPTKTVEAALMVPDEGDFTAKQAQEFIQNYTQNVAKLPMHWIS